MLAVKLIGIPVFPAMLSLNMVATCSAVVLDPKFDMAAVVSFDLRCI